MSGTKRVVRSSHAATFGLTLRARTSEAHPKRTGDLCGMCSVADAPAGENAGATISVQAIAGEPASRPDLPRSGHCLAQLPAWHEDDAVMFGGYVEAEGKQRYATNEAWTFNVGEGAWKRVNASGSSLPRARLVSQAVVVEDALWVVGGWDPGFTKDGGDILADVWKLDLRSFTWEQIVPQGEILEPISRFQAAAVGQKIYIHTHRSTKDILVLDTSPPSGVPSLAKVPVKELLPGVASPPPRGLHSMTAIGESLYVFAGAASIGPMMNDLWRLDLASMEWQQLHPGGPQPHACCSQVAAAVGNHIFFFGGASYGQSGGLVMSDALFYLDTQRNVWVIPSANGRLPSPRNAAAMCVVDGGLLLHAGWQAFVETFNDTYLLTQPDNKLQA